MLKGYRTFIASGLTVAFGVLASADWISILSSPKDGIWTIGIGILFAVLRLYTTTPPGEAEHPDTKTVEKLPEIIENLPNPPVKEALKTEIKVDLQKEIKNEQKKEVQGGSKV